MKIDGCEDVWMEVTVNDKTKIVVGAVYRHPQSNIKLFSMEFKKKILCLKTYKRFIILGDINIDYNCYNSSNSVRIYANGITSLGCKQLISCPTRISLKKKSILDHIYVDSTMIDEVVTTAVIEHDISDHFPIVVKLNTLIKRKEIFRPLVRKIAPEMIENFIIELDSVLKRSDPTNMSELTSNMINVIDNFFPTTRMSRKQFKSSKKPWITRGILTSIKHQTQLYNIYKKSLNMNDFNRYKSYRNKLTHVKEASKAKYYQKFVGHSKDSTTTWKAVNKILRKTNHYLINCLVN